MTIKEIRRELATTLAPSVGIDEAQAMSDIIVQDILDYPSWKLVTNGNTELVPETTERMRRIAKRVLGGEPLQYVLGIADFHGRKFYVDRSTLIPRPETSQLVDIIVNDNQNRSDLNVLDIGTGTGCIAISLALDLRFPKVEAIDISSHALEIAKKNAVKNKAKVTFALQDALHLTANDKREKYDIIISNPPYVLNSEKSEMDLRVLDYEPSSALFVPDNNPLIFYKAIGEYASETLAQNGTVYFEINPLCGKDLVRIMQQLGFSDTNLLRDYKGNIRFAVCKR